MNNRQKAKHFKRKYETLLGKAFKPTIYECPENKQITRLAIRRTIPNDVIKACEWSPEAETPMSHIKESIAREFADEILGRIKFKLSPSRRFDCTDMEAEINIVE